MIVYTACLALGLLFTIISAVADHFFGGHDGGGALEPGVTRRRVTITVACPDFHFSAPRYCLVLLLPLARAV